MESDQHIMSSVLTDPNKNEFPLHDQNESICESTTNCDMNNANNDCSSTSEINIAHSNPKLDDTESVSAPSSEEHSNYNNVGSDLKESNPVSDVCISDSTSEMDKHDSIKADQREKNPDKANKDLNENLGVIDTSDTVPLTLTEVCDSNVPTSVPDESGKNEWQDILGSGQLRKKIIQAGIPGDKPLRGAIVTVDMIGYVNNIEVEKYENHSFQLGDLEVVQGLDLAIQLMERNEKAEIIVYPKLAYDILGDPPLIPSSAVIEYVVTLKDFLPEPDHDSLTVEERLEIGGKKRTRGNFWFNRKDYSQAAQCYRRALDYLDDLDSSNTRADEDVTGIFKERLKVLNNMAAAQLNMKSYAVALKSLENVLMCEPNNVKALFRKSKVLNEQGNYKEAVVTLKQALVLEPDSKGLQQELHKIMHRQRAENEKEKSLYQKMLNINKSKDSLKKSSSLLQWSAAIGGVAAIIAGVFLFRYRYL